jgi:hypothetical protein
MLHYTPNAISINGWDRDGEDIKTRAAKSSASVGKALLIPI